MITAIHILVHTHLFRIVEVCDRRETPLLHFFDVSSFDECTQMVHVNQSLSLWKHKKMCSTWFLSLIPLDNHFKEEVSPDF